MIALKRFPAEPGESNPRYRPFRRRRIDRIVKYRYGKKRISPKGGEGKIYSPAPARREGRRDVLRGLRQHSRSRKGSPHPKTLKNGLIVDPDYVYKLRERYNNTANVSRETVFKYHAIIPK